MELNTCRKKEESIKYTSIVAPNMLNTLSTNLICNQMAGNWEFVILGSKLNTLSTILMCNQMAGNWEFVIPESMLNTLSTILISL